MNGNTKTWILVVLKLGGLLMFIIGNILLISKNEPIVYIAVNFISIGYFNWTIAGELLKRIKERNQ